MRSEILAACAAAQRRLKVSPLDRFVRGGYLIVVTAVDAEAGTISWRDVASDQVQTAPSATFRERALTRVDVVLGPDDEDPVELAWGIARLTSLSAPERARIMRGLLSGDAAKDATIQGWISDLLAGRELTREPK